MKICTKCGETKELDQFYMSRKSSDKRNSQCIECDRERQKLGLKRHGVIPRTKTKNEKYSSKYGITPACYAKLLSEQDGVCAICKEFCDKLEVDHCHKTGIIRGLLCGKCNRGIGQFNDDIKKIQGAIDYLSAPRKVDLFEILFACGRN
jgi:hypothetical protein